MPKIKVFVRLENKETKTTLEQICHGILLDHKIIYYEEKRVVTIYLDSNTIKMIRKENESSIVLTFHEGKKENCIYELKQVGNFEITTETSLLEMNDNKVHICYKTKLKDELMGNFDFHLHYEVIE